MNIVLVTSLEEARKVVTEGKIPVVDMVTMDGPRLADQLRGEGILQALWKDCCEAMLAGKLEGASIPEHWARLGEVIRWKP